MTKEKTLTRRELAILRQIVSDHRDSEVATGSTSGQAVAERILYKLSAAALADAAATTTPVVVGEQAGDVRQAWRVKPLVWSASVGGFYTAINTAHEKIEIMWDRLPNGEVQYILYPATNERRPFKTLEAAKDAANADRAAALEPDPTPAMTLAFGHGGLVVDTGTYAGIPAVFIAPSEMPGPVGEKAVQNRPLDELIEGEIVLTSPTDEQACMVADALVNQLADPTPALGWKAMQTAAAQACQNEIDHCIKQSGGDKSTRMGAVLPGFEWIARSDAENGGFANVMSPDWDAYCDILDQDGNTLQKGETVAGAAFHAYSPDPARAWLIAILRALIAQEEGA